MCTRVHVLDMCLVYTRVLGRASLSTCLFWHGRAVMVKPSVFRYSQHFLPLSHRQEELLFIISFQMYAFGFNLIADCKKAIEIVKLHI